MLKTKNHEIIGNVPDEGLPPHVVVEQRLMRLRDVKLLTGLSGATIYRLIAEGRFPKQIHPLGNRTSAWRSSDVNAWVAERFNGKAA